MMGRLPRWRWIPVLLASLLVQGVVFLSVPVFHALFFDSPERKKREGIAVSSVEVVVQKKKPLQEIKQIKRVQLSQTKLQTASTSQARSQAFQMDLSLESQGGGNGVGVAVGGGGMANAVYDPSEVDEQVKVLQEAPYDFPPRARRDGVNGAVRVFFVVDARGGVSSVRVLAVDPPGYGFEQEAERAIRRYRFEPAKLQGAPVAQKVIKEFRFEVGY